MRPSLSLDSSRTETYFLLMPSDDCSTPSTEKKPIVLTCAQPSNKLHLGNYLGAISHWVGLQDDYTCFFGIVDLHAMTLPYTPADLRHHSLDCAAQYMACGLDPRRCHIFLQSHIQGLTELAWVLTCLCPLGQLERMTQFKDKSQRGGPVGSGLLFYPVLQAADILLYNADLVPVGEDQKQHLELTRDLAAKFNHTFSPTFTLPEVQTPEKGARIFSLQNPSAKMSKSDPNTQGTLFLFEPVDSIRKKIRSAVTDSESSIYIAPHKPGIANLLELFHVISGESIESLVNRFEGKTYAPFKEALADAVIAKLEPMQARYQALMRDKAFIVDTLRGGVQAAQLRANRILSKVRRKVGVLDWVSS